MKNYTHPLSPLQQGMLFHSLSARAPGIDIEQVVCELPERVEPDALEKSWSLIVQRHSVLRTSFQWRGQGGPCQEVHPALVVPLQRRDWSDMPPADRENAFAAWLRADRLRTFDLGHPPLMRLALFCFGADECRLVWTCHHLLLDGRSIGLVLGEVLMTYDALVRGETAALPPTRPFSDYVDWLEAQDWTSAQSFWREQLSGFTAPTPLLASLGRTEDERVETGHLRGERRVDLSPETTNRLRTWSKESGLTLNTFVQGTWALMLSRYTGEEDVVFGAVRACRRSSIDGADTVVGPLINTVPLRVRVANDLPLVQWLTGIRAQWLGMRLFEHAPLARIQGWSEVARSLPMFETFVSFQEHSWEDELSSGAGNHGGRRFHRLGQSNYPVALDVSAGEVLSARITYHRDRLSDAVIDRMAGHWQTLLEAMAEQPGAKVVDLPMLSGRETQMMLFDWNATGMEVSGPATVHGAFEEQAARTPDRVAVVCGGQTLTYRELDDRAEQLAAALRASGVGPDIRVGICLRRSVEMMVGLLGILKAGGCYVPLDPSYPEEWLRFVLSDCGARVLVSDGRFEERLSRASADGLTFHRVPAAAGDVAGAGKGPAPASRCGAITSPGDGSSLAYLIYTSGSTGRPKGVMVEHRNVCNFFAAMDRLLGRDAGTWMAVTSISFDISVLELFWTVARGFTVVLQDQAPSIEEPSGGETPDNPWTSILAHMRVHRVTHLQCTPSLAGTLVDQPGAAEILPGLSAFLLGGETLPVPLAEKILRLAPGRVFNMYGPTETAVWSAAHRIENVSGRVPIGRPLANTRFYILDSVGRPVPIGVTGELYIGGAGVTRGYLNQPELTAERFVEDRFSARPGSRLYRTGDLGRFLEDGSIEFLGRRDHQIKLRGHRIELGEIETALAQHPRVRECAVRAWESPVGDQRLAAYVVSGDGHETSELAGELRRYVRSRLPEHMVPGALVFLTDLPRTRNGKVDRKALPAPKEDRSEANYLPPRTDLERAIADLWRELLGVGQVGLNDNFFDLGGHSLLVVRMHALLREKVGVDVPIVRFFQHPTVSALAEILSQPEKRASLSKAQERAQRQKAAFASRRQELAV